MSECPKCGADKWVSHSDGLGGVMSVAWVCVPCGYIVTRLVDLGE